MSPYRWQGVERKRNDRLMTISGPAGTYLDEMRNPHPQGVVMGHAKPVPHGYGL